MCYHPIKIIYEKHISDFCKAFIEKENINLLNIGDLKKFTESSVIKAMNDAYFNDSSPLHDKAKMINDREHFRCVFSRELQSADIKEKTPAFDPNIGINKDLTDKVYEKLSESFGKDQVYKYEFFKEDIDPDWMSFPVKKRDDSISEPFEVSQILNNQFPKVGCFYVYVNQNHKFEADDLVKKCIQESRGGNCDGQKTEVCIVN